MGRHPLRAAVVAVSALLMGSGTGTGTGTGTGQIATPHPNPTPTPNPTPHPNPAPNPGAPPEVLEGERFRLPLPAEFRELPELAVPGADAIERRGVGDPASGCYALLQVASGDGAVEPEALHAALADALAEAGLAEVGPQTAADRAAVLGRIPPDPTATVVAGRSTLPLRGRGVEGALTTWIITGEEQSAAVSLACFHDGREPLWCRARCDEALGALEVRP
jgi:hypothetical protein